MVRAISEASPEVVRDGMVELFMDSVEEELLFSVGHEMMNGVRRYGTQPYRDSGTMQKH